MGKRTHCRVISHIAVQADLRSSLLLALGAALDHPGPLLPRNHQLEAIEVIEVGFGLLGGDLLAPCRLLELLDGSLRCQSLLQRLLTGTPKDSRLEAREAHA